MHYFVPCEVKRGNKRITSPPPPKLPLIPQLVLMLYFLSLDVIHFYFRSLPRVYNLAAELFTPGSVEALLPGRLQHLLQ